MNGTPQCSRSLVADFAPRPAGGPSPGDVDRRDVHAGRDEGQIEPGPCADDQQALPRPKRG
jgi:hypothetical protein